MTWQRPSKSDGTERDERPMVVLVLPQLPIWDSTRRRGCSWQHALWKAVQGRCLDGNHAHMPQGVSIGAAASRRRGRLVCSNSGRDAKPMGKAIVATSSPVGYVQLPAAANQLAAVAPHHLRTLLGSRLRRRGRHTITTTRSNGTLSIVLHTSANGLHQ